MKAFHIAIGLVAILSLTGCGTLVTRVGGGGRADYYPATIADVSIISSGGGIYAYGDCNNGFGPVVGWLVVVPLHLIDLPISIVIDTICLPYDAIRAQRENERKSRTFQMQVGVATTNAPALLLLETSVTRWERSGFREPLNPLWATFQCLSSGEIVKAQYNTPFSYECGEEKYKVVYFDKDYVHIEKQKR